jgi:hypothetical protein
MQTRFESQGAYFDDHIFADTCVWRIPILSHKSVQNLSLVMPVLIVTMVALCAI